MQALLLQEIGSLDNFVVGEAPLPEPGPGDVRVRIQAVSLNPVDYKLALGGFGTWSYPWIVGVDGAGVIDAIGADVDFWEPGDRVFYHGDLSRPGTFAQYAVVTDHTIARIPNHVDYVTAAALPCAAMTAYQALARRLHVGAGQTVLIQAGAGGVGGFAIQIAQRAGCRVFTTASAGNHEYVKSLGADHAIDYNTTDVAAAVADLTGGRGVDAILDGVGSTTATAGIAMLAFGGGMACIAGLPDLDIYAGSGKALSLHAIMLGGAYLNGDRDSQEELARMDGALMGLAEEGKLKHTITQTLDGLADIPAGLKALAGGHVRGKIVAHVG